MKKIIVFFAVAVFLLLSTTRAFAIGLWVYGQPIQGDVEPFVENERILVPIRLISETFGYQVNWDEATRQITISGEKTVILTLDRTEAIVDGTPVALDIAPVVRSERTFVPLRFIAETFGHPVSWHQATQVAAIGNGYSEDMTPTAPSIEAPSSSQAPAPETPKDPTGLAYLAAQGRIIANKRSGIYHMPHQIGYTQVLLKNAVFFDTEAQAKAAGYRPAQQ